MLKGNNMMFEFENGFSVKGLHMNYVTPFPTDPFEKHCAQMPEKGFISKK